MLKDITLGQYFPGGTIAHRLDPRVKLVLTTVYITALFLAKGFISYVFIFIILAACVAVSKIKFNAILRGLRPVMFVIIIAAIFNIFFTPGTVIMEYSIIKVTREGLYAMCYMSARLIMLVAGTFMLTYTTSPIALTDGLEIMLGPLRRIKIPVHELAMMMSIALRFIPALIEETDKIMSAQKARGADFETGGLIKRARAVLPLIIPLFVSAFRRADELAVAMESRCYHGGEGRTRMKVLKMVFGDYTALVLGGMVLAAVIILRRFGL